MIRNMGLSKQEVLDNVPFHLICMDCFFGTWERERPRWHMAGWQEVMSHAGETQNVQHCLITTRRNIIKRNASKMPWVRARNALASIWALSEKHRKNEPNRAMRQ